MLSFSTPSDDKAVVSIRAYDWVFGFHPNQPVLPSPQGRLRRGHGKKQARASHKTTEGYWVSPPTGVFRTHTLHGVEFFTDPKVQACLVFKELVEQWRAERRATSSITAMAMCDAYQKIIGMGPDAIPLIIGQLRSEADEPDQWFWALQVLTGVNPVADEDRGDFVKMAQSWINWAENKENAW
jgi:hypothetical protein